VLSAIGVTRRIDQDQLLAFASDRGYVYKVLSYQDLGVTIQLTRNAILAHCGRVTVSYTTPARMCPFVFTTKWRKN